MKRVFYLPVSVSFWVATTFGGQIALAQESVKQAAAGYYYPGYYYTPQGGEGQVMAQTYNPYAYYGYYDPYAYYGYYGSPFAIQPATETVPEITAPPEPEVVISSAPEKVIEAVKLPEEPAFYGVPEPEESLRRRDNIDFYVGASAAVPVLPEIELTGFGGNPNVKSNGDSLSIAGGYNVQFGIRSNAEFGAIRFEGEYGNEVASITGLTIDGTTFNQKGDLKQQSYGANLFFDLGDEKFIPYFGAGLGGVNAELKVSGTEKSESSWYYQALGGAMIKVFGNSALKLGYRYRSEIEFSGGIEMKKEPTHVVEAGVSFTF